MPIKMNHNILGGLVFVAMASVILDSVDILVALFTPRNRASIGPVPFHVTFSPTHHTAHKPQRHTMTVNTCLTCKGFASSVKGWHLQGLAQWDESSRYQSEASTCGGLWDWIRNQGPALQKVTGLNLRQELAGTSGSVRGLFVGSRASTFGHLGAESAKD